jgi:hypothetical protein
MDTNIWCCIVAIVLGVGNVACWFVVFRGQSRVKVNESNVEIEIGRKEIKNLVEIGKEEKKEITRLQKENKLLIKTVNSLKRIIKELIDSKNKKNAKK